MQEEVIVSGERGVIGRSLDRITTRFGRKPTDLVFRGITLLLVFIVIAIVIGVAAGAGGLLMADHQRLWLELFDEFGL